MRRRSPSIVVVAALAVLIVTGVGEQALADFYRCRIEGREWLTNHIPRGQRRHCRLAMKTAPTGEASDDAAEGGGGSSPGRTSKPAERVVTPRPSAPRSEASLPAERIWRLVLEAAERYHLPPAFILAVIKTESNFHPRAVSRVGAAGLMQLMPKTAEGLGVTDAFDPRQNIMGGSRYLRMLANRFDGDMVRTLSGYHAGGSAVEKKAGVPWAATEKYVRWVLDRYYEYKVLLADGL